MAAPGVRRAGGRFLTARGISTAAGNAYLGAPAPSALLEDSAATAGRELPAPPPPSAAASRITPAVLFVTVVLAVVLLVSALLHVLRRLFLKTHNASAGAGERQLQHLFFPAHEDGAGSGGGGLAQAAIDALPEFAYAELSSSAAARASRKGKEKAARPFDCAVCLCEFADHDRLRLLPPCGHAFHLACIDVWLRSSATCPLCRTKLSRAAAAAPPPVVVVAEEHKEQDRAEAASSVVLPVRLGRFKNADDDDEAESSTSTSRIDARRCYSMGSYQYVLADDHLLVSVHMRHDNAVGGDDRHQGKKVFARGDSFSVSKIWQWRGSKRLPGGLCAVDGLPWPPAAKDEHSRRQHGDTSC